jgi:hypothetical protein
MPCFRPQRRATDPGHIGQVASVNPTRAGRHALQRTGRWASAAGFDRERLAQRLPLDWNRTFPGTECDQAAHDGAGRIAIPERAYGLPHRFFEVIEVSRRHPQAERNRVGRSHRRAISKDAGGFLHGRTQRYRERTLDRCSDDSGRGRIANRFEVAVLARRVVRAELPRQGGGDGDRDGISRAVRSCNAAP